MSNSYRNCPVCGRTYELQNMTTQKQDVCTSCDIARQKASRAEDTEENIRRRREAYGDHS